MPQEAPATFAAFVGLDWADAQHEVCLPAAGSAQRAPSRLDHTPAAIEAWGCSLPKRCEGKPIAIGLALNKGPIVCALRTYHCLVLFPINPLTLARYREAFPPSRAQDDPTDAALQLALRTHRDTLPPLKPQSPAIRALAQRARRSPLETFLRAHHVRSADVIAQRLNAIKAAIPLTTDAGILTPNVLLVPALVAPLRVTLQAIADCDTAIAQRAQAHPDFPLFDALPGAGAVFAPRRLVAFGAQRERVTSAAELQKYAGIAPVPARSGKKSWGHWRCQCPTRLRQPFVEWAAASIRHACWARGYSQQQCAAGNAHQAAVRALAFKWIRLLFRCWQERTPYDASVSLTALNRRGSSLIHHLAKAA